VHARPITSTPLRYAAFTTPTGGGNPAGVVVDASSLTDDDMQAIARDLAYSETAFLTPVAEGEYRVRYFSPAAEVDFCGHATVASAVALADAGAGDGAVLLHTNAGEIPVSVTTGERGRTATLTSVTPTTADNDALDELLTTFGLRRDDLEPSLPNDLAFGGLWHPVLWLRSRQALAAITYDFDALRALMLDQGWGTVSVLFREHAALIHSRNAFPIGGVVEDPATGAAAAALGGLLRAHGLLAHDGRCTVIQGADMGTPCLIELDAAGDAGVRISGTAEQIIV